MPNIPRKDAFQGRILQSAQFTQTNVLSDPAVQHVIVIGAGNSAADMVYEAVKAGKTVSWIIRESGDNSRGLGFFAPADAKTPYENAGLAAQTRVMASLQPSLLGADTWWTRFLQRTRVGIGIVRWIFSLADAGIPKRAGYYERKSSMGFEKLEYEAE
jgi:hypothetical protein